MVSFTTDRHFQPFFRIYELNYQGYLKRLDFLIEQFEIKDLIKTPVRKLSLGQRMRCEIVASLLHRPKVIFLDEPTIGLEVSPNSIFAKLFAI